MNDYEGSLMNALDIIKDSERCRECVGNCIECEYSNALEQIEDAIHDYCKLIDNIGIEKPD